MVTRNVYILVRPNNSLGNFTWRTVPVELEGTDDMFRAAAIDIACDSGYETCGTSLEVPKAHWN